MGRNGRPVSVTGSIEGDAEMHINFYLNQHTILIIINSINRIKKRTVSSVRFYMP